MEAIIGKKPYGTKHHIECHHHQGFCGITVYMLCSSSHGLLSLSLSCVLFPTAECLCLFVWLQQLIISVYLARAAIAGITSHLQSGSTGRPITGVRERSQRDSGLSTPTWHWWSGVLTPHLTEWELPPSLTPCNLQSFSRKHRAVSMAFTWVIPFPLIDSFCNVFPEQQVLNTV